MLRITRKTNGRVLFKVSAQLTAEHVAAMEALIVAEGKEKRIVCTDLQSVDGKAVNFLEKWEAASIKKNCGLYIREWIKPKKKGAPDPGIFVGGYSGQQQLRGIRNRTAQKSSSGNRPQLSEKYVVPAATSAHK